MQNNELYLQILKEGSLAAMTGLISSRNLTADNTAEKIAQAAMNCGKAFADAYTKEVDWHRQTEKSNKKVVSV